MKLFPAFLMATCAVSLLSTAPVEAKDHLWFMGKDGVIRRDWRDPVFNAPDTTITLWRGERGSLQAMFIPENNTGRLKLSLHGDGVKLPESFKPYFTDYVITNSYRHCDICPDALPIYEVADAIVRPEGPEAQHGAQRPIWLTLDVPRDAKPGDYPAYLLVEDIYKNTVPDTLRFTVRVLDRQLPAPKDYKFNLDMWQQPYAISRFYNVEPWSEKHFEYLKPYAQLLARGGQKLASAILIYEPWGEQSRDKFLPMIETVKDKNGNWKYDYTIFDKYVEFMAENGVDGGIECFSMIPWNMSFRYFDEASNSYKTLQAVAKSKEYRDFWFPFVKSFADHLRKKGWFEKTIMSIDERQLPDMLVVYDLIQEAAPGMKIALAGNYHKELEDKVDMYTVTVGAEFPEDARKRRHEKGKINLRYTCCSTMEPNIFSNNEPIDAAFLPVHCYAVGADGYLHWAFSNWTENPVNDTRFYLFAPGDTYCVYPYGGSSVRYERMIEGIEMTEKIRILRDELKAKGNKTALMELDAALDAMKNDRAHLSDRTKAYNNLAALVARLSK